MTTKITTHFLNAFARQLTQFKDDENFTGLIKSYSNQIQEIEDEFYKFFSMTIDGAEGSQLDDTYGKIANIDRLPLETDDDYRVRIKVRMLSLRSSGDPEQLLEIAVLMASITYELKEYYPAAYEITALETLTASLGQLIADELKIADKIGVDGKFRWTRHTLDNTFRFNQTSMRKTVGANKDLKSIADSGSLFVAVGDDVIVKSADGETWSIARNDPTEYWRSIVYDSVNLLFIAVGSSGKIITSLDGTTWINQTSGISSTIYDIKTHNGTSICVYYGVDGGGKHTIRSTNGTTWTLVEGNATLGLTAIDTDKNGTWLASSGTTPSQLVKSIDDGLTWSLIPSHDLDSSGFIEDRCLIYNDSKWIVGHKVSDSYVKYSTDCITWTTAYTAVGGEDEAYFERLRVYSNKYYIPCGYNVIVYSEDLVTWTLIKTFYNGLNDIVCRISTGERVICGDDVSGDALILNLNSTLSGKGFGSSPGFSNFDRGFWSEVD